jgi:16S rRNA (adenine1518-N6/adenine1519-N6)-dimethyltransferase
MTSRERARPHQPRKRFGQHFLLPGWAEKVVRAINPVPGDVFLEIGPGTGALTLPLAATGVPILAVEIDRDLSKALAAQVPSNVTLLTGDALKIDVVPYLTGLEPQRPVDLTPAGRPPRRRFRVVGNLPYQISSPILFHLVELHRRHRIFADATIMVQREFADRLTSRVGTKDYGVLGISAQMHARITRLLELPPSAFKPAPKVRSAVVQLAFGEPAAPVSDEALFHALLRAMFSQRRKTLLNALKRFDPTAPAVLALCDIDPRRRPETLQVSEIARLADLFASVRRPVVL